MWNVFGYTIACAVFGSLWPSSEAAGLFGSLLGDNENNNNSPSIPIIGALDIGSNRNEQNRQNNNYNQYPNNNNQYANNNDNKYVNSNYQYTNNNNNGYTNNNNVNRGLLSVFGGNANVNRPNTNNVNNLKPYPNTGQNNPNVNDIKNQVKYAENLLERLKEQQKLKEENENSQGHKQLDTAIKDLETDNSHVNIKDDNKKKPVLKSLTKKFYFMVKPVVPENEESDQEQTVYYLD